MTWATENLKKLGFNLAHDYTDSRFEYPSLYFERVTSHGYHVETLIFDTVHGGPWTFEMGLKVFILSDQENWTTQERIELNPASRDFIGSNIGHWTQERPVMDVKLCRAVADYIEELERRRKVVTE